MTGLPQTSGIFLCLFLLIFLGSDVSIYQSDCEYVSLCHCVFLCRCICVSLTIIHDRPVSISISDFFTLPLSLTLSHSLSLSLSPPICANVLPATAVHFFRGRSFKKLATPSVFAILTCKATAACDSCNALSPQTFAPASFRPPRSTKLV